MGYSAGFLQPLTAEVVNLGMNSGLVVRYNIHQNGIAPQQVRLKVEWIDAHDIVTNTMFTDPIPTNGSPDVRDNVPSMRLPPPDSMYAMLPDSRFRLTAQGSEDALGTAHPNWQDATNPIICYHHRYDNLGHGAPPAPGSV